MFWYFTYKSKARKALTDYLHRYELLHTVALNDKEVVHEFSFLAKGKQLPIHVTVKERQERGFFGPRAIRYECKNKNTLHTRHFSTLEKLVKHLVVLQENKDRMLRK